MSILQAAAILQTVLLNGGAGEKRLSAIVREK